MTSRARHILFWTGAAVTLLLLVPALVDLASAGSLFDTIADYYLERAVSERRSYNVVSSVIFDYRGFDTMFEQLILFAAVVAVTLLLRVQSAEEEREPRDSIESRDVPPTAPAIRLAGVALAGFALFIGVYVILAVHITPGGGFQSGVVIAGGLLAIYLADEYRVYDRLTEVGLVERIEAGSAAVYLLMGLAGLVVSGSFLANFLPLGEPGGVYAGGTIWVLNLVVSFEVTAGFVMIYTEFLDQAVLIRERAPS